MEKDSNTLPQPSIIGMKSYSDDSVCYVWAVYNKSDCPVLVREHEQAMACNEDTQSPFDLAYALTGWRTEYNGPGRSFANEPTARVSRNRILVTQRRGIDI